MINRYNIVLNYPAKFLQNYIFFLWKKSNIWYLIWHFICIDIKLETFSNFIINADFFKYLQFSNKNILFKTCLCNPGLPV